MLLKLDKLFSFLRSRYWWSVLFLPLPQNINKPHEVAGGIGKTVDGYYHWTIKREPSYSDFFTDVWIEQL